MTAPYTGSPIAHPDRKRVATFTGHIDDQIHDLQSMIAMLRTGWSAERAPKPFGYVVLKLDQDAYVSGIMLTESISRVRHESSQFFLTEWDERIFRCHIVRVDQNGNMTVETWENPPDPLHIPSPIVYA